MVFLDEMFDLEEIGLLDLQDDDDLIETLLKGGEVIDRQLYDECTKR